MYLPRISDYDTSYGGTRIGGDLHDTVAISEDHTRRKDEDILRRSAVCVEADIPADMNCTVVELSDVTIRRRRSPQGQDSAEHKKCCTNVSNTAVEFNDVVFRRLRLPRTEVFAEDMEEKCIVPRTDTKSSDQEDRTFCRPKPPWRVAFTEQDMSCSDMKGDPAVAEPCDRLYRRRSLSPNRSRTEVGGLIRKQKMLFRGTNFPPNSVRRNGSDSYIGMGSFSADAGSLCRRTKWWLYKEQHRDCAVSVQRTSDGVTSSWIVP